MRGGVSACQGVGGPRRETLTNFRLTDDSSDPYILKGSCGLTYNLVKGASGFEDSQYSLPDSSSSTCTPFCSLPHPQLDY